jgi:hypothetical protein
MVKSKKTSTADRLKKTANKESELPSVVIGGKTIELSSKQLSVILAALSGDVEEKAPQKRSPAGEVSVTTTGLKKKNIRKPGVPSIDIPNRIKSINTARTTASGSYNRLRYNLIYMRNLIAKGKPISEERLVNTLKVFKSVMTITGQSFVDQCLRYIEVSSKISNKDTLAAIKAFRKKHLTAI